MIINMQHILDAQVPDAARCLGWTTVTNCDMTRREIPIPGGSWGMEETVGNDGMFATWWRTTHGELKWVINPVIYMG